MLVQAARTADVKATLKVGAMTEVVEVSGAAPLVETSTNAINHTIDMKQIEDLPLAGRNINQLSRLTAGYNGTWNGLPTFAQSNSIDGIIGNTARWRYQTSDSAASIAVTPRIENIAEMVVSTDQMDMNQGFGSSTMSVSYVTRRGTNPSVAGCTRAIRSQLFDATNWGSTVKPKYHRNDFGASLGGPIMKDKLFFFASMAALDIPGGTGRTQNFLLGRREAGHRHVRQRHAGKSLQHLCRAQRGERHVVPDVARQSDDGGAYHGHGRLSAERRRPGPGVGAADRSESADVGVAAREFESDLLSDAPGGCQPVGEVASERGNQPDEK